MEVGGSLEKMNENVNEFITCRAVFEQEKSKICKDGRLLGVDADSRLLKNLNNSRVES